MANQLFTDGDVHQINGETLECVAVAYTEVDGVKENFAYTFRLKSEVDAEREAAREAEEKAEAARKAAEENNVTPGEEQ